MTDRHRLPRLICVLAVVTMTATWAQGPVRTHVAAEAAAKLTDLRGVNELKTLFNQDAGKVRLVLLVSPT